jgi:membrane protease subunit (stomatin/prohibitin family)
MGTNNIIFLEVLEWFDPTGREMVHRIPEEGSGEIKYGAQLFVRDSQAAVFFYQGRAHDAMGPGRHTLKTANIPVLNKILAIPWGLTSPLRAEVYFVNMKTFADLKWGTRDPVAFKDSELGLIRLRAFGVFNIRVVQPVLFVNRLVGTQGMYSTNDIEEYLNRVIVSRFNDLLGEKLDTIFNLPGRYNELADGLQKRLAEDFSHFGMALTHLYINAITPPPEVQKAIDDKSRINVFDDLDKLIKMKAAMAVENAATADGTAASGLGMGMGMGFMMPAMFAEYVKSGAAGKAGVDSPTCPDCNQPVGIDAKFCPHCGHQILVFHQCGQCGKNLPPGAQFCSRCGTAVLQSPPKKVCNHCKTENLPESVFCNQCGEKMA